MEIIKFQREEIDLKRFIKRYGTVIGLLLLCFYFSLAAKGFFSISNFINVLTQISMLSICAFGMSHVILSGNIDLSVGGVVSFVGIVSALTMAITGSALLGIFFGLMAGVLFGSFNGLLVAYLGVPAFICTLANSSVVMGLTYMACKGQPIYQGITSNFTFLGQGYFGGVPMPVIILLVTFVITQIVLTQTKTGRYLYAVGGNSEASRLSGINNKKIVLISFAISGFMAAISGLLMTARLGTGQPSGGTTYTLDAIAASFLGSTAFKEGQINLPGTFVGALIIGVLNNGLTLINTPYYYQNVFKGLLIVAAVALNSYYRGKEGQVHM